MNDSRHCRTCGDTFEACACPSVVMTIADADAANTEIDTLRARVAELEAALESVCVALLPHDSRCQNVNAVFEAHDRARAALKGE